MKASQDKCMQQIGQTRRVAAIDNDVMGVMQYKPDVRHKSTSGQSR